MFVQVLASLLIGLAACERLVVPTDIEEFPSQAQVEFFEEGSWVQRCAATIVNQRHLLSVASCFDASVTNIRIRVGSSTRGIGGELFLIEEIIPHPDFNPQDKQADIAVIRLKETLVFGETVNKVDQWELAVFLIEGVNVTTISWENIASGGKTSGDMYAGTLTVTSNTACAFQYDTTITRNQICLGLGFYGGKDFDSNDKGTAVLMPTRNGGYILEGLLSFGVSDAGDKYPAVATAIAGYSRWLIETSIIINILV